MSNLFGFIAALGLALAAADYFVSGFAAVNDLIPLLLALPSSYIYISVFLFVCTYKLFTAKLNLFSAMSGIINHFPV